MRFLRAEMYGMAKRNIFNISGEGLQKEAFVQALVPLVRAALPYLGRAAFEVGKTVAVEKAFGFITKQVARRGVDAVVSSLMKGGGKDASDVKELLSSVLKADPKSPIAKSLLPDARSRGMIERLSEGLSSASGGRDEPRRRGGLMDMLSGGGRGRPEWESETRPFREPENVRLARRDSRP